MHGEFVVPIHDLDVSGRDLRVAIPKGWLAAQLEGSELRPAGPDGKLDVHLSKSGRDVVVRGTVDVALEVSCARCLEPFTLEPHIDLTLLLTPAPHAPPAPGRPKHAPRHEAPAKDEPKRRRAAPEEVEFASDDADVDHYEGDEVVLDRFVREAVLLEEPIFPLCSEACEGIRPPSRAAAEAESEHRPDPRLAPILELVAKRKNKE